MATQHSPSEPNSLIGQPLLEGWMLKKKRKKMQGFARRYFYLSEQPATLSYSFSPQSRIRDSIYISLASISISRRSRSIHIDSGGSVVMHIKTLSDSDFLRWTDVLKSLVTNGGVKEQERRQRRRKAAKKNKSSDSAIAPAIGLGLNVGINALRPLDMTTVYHCVSRMQAPLVALESIQTTLRELLLGNRESPLPLVCELPTGKSTTPSVSPNVKGKKPHIFRHHSQCTPQTGTVPDVYKVVKIITEALSELRTEHLNLVDLLNAHSTTIKNQPSHPLVSPPGLREDLRISNGTLPISAGLSRTQPAAPGAPPSQSTTIYHREGGTNNRSEISLNADDKSDSNETESDLTFHDAASVEGVFVDLDAIHSGQEHVEETEFESTGSGISSDDSQTDSSSEDEGSGHRRTDSVHTVKSLKTRRRSPSDTRPLIKRRTELPATVCGDEFSVFAMLRKNVGKDLSQVSFPISFNEPLSALQKLCEDCEYADQLIRRGVHATDPIERLVYISAFAVSAFCSTKTRATRKPFNPILGETYECVRPDKGMKYISEKVSHHPPIMAAYAEGDDWKLELTSSIRQKFWGKSLEVIPEGSTKLTVYNPGDASTTPRPREAAGVFHWDKPSSFVRNLMSGTKYLEHIGKITVSNDCGPEKATIEFKPGTTFGGEASRNKVEIKVLDADGQVQATVTGRWDSELIQNDPDELIFEAAPWPKRAADFYGFTQFAIELNEITEDIQGRLPATDSRLRPDQRLFEEGKITEAEVVKSDLEERQRARRKRGEHVPTWFEKQANDWVYKGGYFEARDNPPTGWNESDLF